MVLWMGNQGNKYNGSNGGSYGSQIDIGNIGMVAVDMDNGKIWFLKMELGLGKWRPCCWF